MQAKKQTGKENKASNFMPCNTSRSENSGDSLIKAVNALKRKNSQINQI